MDTPLVFPCIPSAKYYYLSSKGHRVPLPNQGSDEEMQTSAEIWYSMKNTDVTPLHTVYAHTREAPGPSELALSLKSYVRQAPDYSDWITADDLYNIGGTRLVTDLYLFPPNPSADIFKVARLLDRYRVDGDEGPLRRYLRERGITHLDDHPFDYYPLYYLFFLLTRFASYPFSQEQLVLVRERAETVHQSPARVFIDAIFDSEIGDVDEVLDIVHTIQTKGPLAAGKAFNTHYEDWYRWGSEYLHRVSEPASTLPADILYTWTDDQVDNMCRELDIPIPDRKQHPTRYSYIAFIAGIASRRDPGYLYRA